jgi:hypothetical protein
VNFPDNTPPANGELRGDDVPVAPTLEELADDLLAGAAAVVAGGVDHIAARVGVGIDHAPALVDGSADTTLLAEGHRTEEGLGDP